MSRWVQLAVMRRKSATCLKLSQPNRSRSVQPSKIPEKVKSGYLVNGSFGWPCSLASRDRRRPPPLLAVVTVLVSGWIPVAVAQQPTAKPTNGAPDSTQAMEFADQPNFAIAGVTDWTAVGGHGSDSTLRTSEALASETLTLKSVGPEHSAAGGDASEANLRAALAGAPGSFEANHRLGEFYLQAGNYHESVPLLLAAYRIDPTN